MQRRGRRTQLVKRPLGQCGVVHALAQCWRECNRLHRADKAHQRFEQGLAQHAFGRTKPARRARHRVGVQCVDPRRIAGLEQHRKQRRQFAGGRRAGQHMGLHPGPKFARERHARAEAKVGEQRRCIDVAPEHGRHCLRAVAQPGLSFKLVQQVLQPQCRARCARVVVKRAGRSCRVGWCVAQPFHQPHQPQVAFGQRGLRVGRVEQRGQVPAGCHLSPPRQWACLSRLTAVGRWVWVCVCVCVWATNRMKCTPVFGCNPSTHGDARAARLPTRQCA